jgi:hypothetical protein
MKRQALFAIGVGVVFLAYVSVGDSFSRGRGGFGGASRGGGGGGGSAYRGGGASHRSPSMSSYARTRSTTSQHRSTASHQAASRPSRPTPTNRNAGQRLATASPKPGAGQGARHDANFGMAGKPRPTQGQINQFLNLPQQPGGRGGSDLAKIGAGVAAGALGAEGARRLLEGARGPGDGARPSQLPAGPGDRLGQGVRPGDRDRPGSGDKPGMDHRPPISQLPNHPQRPGADRPNADRIRDNMENRWDNLFTPSWWKDHPQLAKKYWDETGKHQWARNHWWRHATWAAAAGWAAGSVYASDSGYGEPVMYDYGENVYYDDESVYVQGNKVATAAQYYDQASTIATSAQSAPTEPDANWMPLGVFALSQRNAPSSNMVLQLALSKEGVVKGTYYNTNTDTVRPIKGRVDKKSQRVAWTFDDGKNTDIVMETGLYNLTQDQTEALVHFGKDKTQQWLMVRLNQPENGKPGNKASSR